MRITPRAFLAVAMAVQAIALPLSAAGLTSTIGDAAGDAAVTGQGTAVADYQDIVGASVTLSEDRFALVMDLAGPIPARPPLPHGAKLIEWAFRLNTNLSTCPAGFPYPPAPTLTSAEVTHCAEYIVFIIWDGTGFTGMLIDRTPLLTGNDALISPVSFNIAGKEISVSFKSTLVGNPQAFRWTTRTETWFTELGSMGFVVVDAAPDEGFFATWPD